MAWTPNGHGGSISLGGELTPQNVVTPWEVLVGENVNNLSANIKKGMAHVDVPVRTSIPFLGIRTQERWAFEGGPSYNPNIDYGSAVNLDTFVNGVTTLTLEVKDSTNRKIGTLTAPFSAAGVFSWKAADGSGGAAGAYAIDPNRMFKGGVPKSQAAASPLSDSLAKSIMPGIEDHFDSQGHTVSGVSWSGTDERRSTYSGYYAGGITAGSLIRIKLDAAAIGDDVITWKAAMPIVVSYQ
ncbi:TPA: fimbrial protein [Escherichia coli]|nr:fimbrial protein [Escherichia coli]